ncbi:hypothetical protein T265_10661 [Opisthorchis viverrini]|uniref:Uncharacterized protein n=1 Tax=Opisthorchis viverrini TaxID=6198 RepID=A0A075A0C2_OPIVI|nr:hypothetical protein T265_10661 [Opisthorchis viverrini]KER20874.1 hypothetical protein T265_10661 [Opisthorchis viverrini]
MDFGGRILRKTMQSNAALATGIRPILGYDWLLGPVFPPIRSRPDARPASVPQSCVGWASLLYRHLNASD